MVTLTPDAAGALTFDVKPVRTTRYRLETEGGASPALLVQVAPRLTLARPTAAEPGVLGGTVKPKLPGAVVAVERRKGSTWALVGEVVVDGAGAFTLELDAPVPAGSYRARSTASGGLRRRHVACRAGVRMRRIALTVVLVSISLALPGRAARRARRRRTRSRVRRRTSSPQPSSGARARTRTA